MLDLGKPILVIDSYSSIRPPHELRRIATEYGYDDSIPIFYQPALYRTNFDNETDVLVTWLNENVAESPFKFQWVDDDLYYY